MLDTSRTQALLGNRSTSVVFQKGSITVQTDDLLQVKSIFELFNLLVLTALMNGVSGNL